MNINLDNFFRTKLNEVDFDFKPEYWDEMKKNLEKEGAYGGAGGGFFGNTISKVAFVIIVAVIFGGLIYFINRDKDMPVVDENQNLQNTPAQVTPVNIKVDKTDDVAVEDKSVKPKVTVRKIKKSARVRKQPVYLPQPCLIRPSIMDDINKRMVKDAEIRMQNSFRPYDIGALEYDMGEEVVIPVKPAVADDGESQAVPKKIDKPDRPKEYKPMQKPVKHVFGKKKGILYRLGLRKK